MQTAYGLGMRKFIISNMGPIGCAPSVLSTRSQNGECIQEVNGYAITFNAALKPMLESLQAELPGSVFLNANAFDVVKSILDNPLKYGNFHSLHLEGLTYIHNLLIVSARFVVPTIHTMFIEHMINAPST